MRMEEVNARKDYIQKVRQSFDAPDRNYEFQYETDTKGEASDDFSFFKVRMLIAVLIFAVYVFCDKTGTKVYQYTAEDVADEIARTYDYNEAREEIVQVLAPVLPK